MTVLRKPDGGVRGITVGDIIRGLVARTITKQIARQTEEASAPYQFAFNTKRGASVWRTSSKLRWTSILVSIDGVGACDSISRNAMEGLLM